jgi:YD repeat-containing protein
VTDPQGRVATFSYDAGDELTAIDYSDAGTPDVSGVGYDALGRRTAVTDATGSSSWSYDSLGRLTASAAGDGQSVGDAYDLDGRVTGVTYPGSVGTVDRAYDDTGRLTGVTDPDARASTFAYDPMAICCRARSPAAWRTRMRMTVPMR